MLNKRHLPSITALQCFEAVTRHLSFTRAAEELNLTQSAVSKQVAQLEELLHLPVGDEVRKLVKHVEEEGVGGRVRGHVRAAPHVGVNTGLIGCTVCHPSRKGIGRDHVVAVADLPV